MKLAKRITNRSEIISFNNSYHGSTQGALSVLGSEHWRNAFRPLLPGILHEDYGSQKALDTINEQTCCVIAETIQAEAGIITASGEWMKALRKKCSETGTILILDEIQTGFGRTGRLWGFEHYDIIPDILLLGKALGGGMPLGAFIADRSMMAKLSANPVLGHITTFGGHPVSCAAGMAGFQVLLDENMIGQVKWKEDLFKTLLLSSPANPTAHRSKIKTIRSFGLWLAIEFDSFETNRKVIGQCMGITGPSEKPGALITDWFLFAPNCLRICPPLTITEDQIRTACEIISGAVIRSL